MADYPATLADRTQLLMPGTGLGERADASLDELHQRGLVAAANLTEYHLAQQPRWQMSRTSWNSVLMTQ